MCRIFHRYTALQVKTMLQTCRGRRGGPISQRSSGYIQVLLYGREDQRCASIVYDSQVTACSLSSMVTAYSWRRTYISVDTSKHIYSYTMNDGSDLGRLRGSCIQARSGTASESVRLAEQAKTRLFCHHHLHRLTCVFHIGSFFILRYPSGQLAAIEQARKRVARAVGRRLLAYFVVPSIRGYTLVKIRANVIIRDCSLRNSPLEHFCLRNNNAKERGPITR
ncbi:hypothetical protein EDD85DRAFT_145496 [Armillaria nabsnona]|nr:hypothetical protein EDD85DRAFT_145496 [Armillaria nabsnona]